MAIENQSRKCSVTIDNTKVSGSGNLSNFPVLLTVDNLPSEMFDADGSYPALSGGGDIRFTSDEAGTTELAREIETFTIDNDPANGVAEIWVNVTTLDYNDDTVIYVWYNDSGASEPAADSTYGSENAWNGSFKGVWHLDESSGSRSDSTSNGNTLADTNTVGSQTGKIGTATNYVNGNSEYLSIADASATGLEITGDITFSFWFEKEALMSAFQYVLAKYDHAAKNGYYLIIRDTEKFGVRYGAGSTFTDITQDTAAYTSGELNTWIKVDIAIDVSARTATFYVNGSADTSTTTTSGDTSIGTTSGDFYLGVLDIAGTKYDYWDDGIDELRVYSGLLTTDWVATEYANQNSPSTFSSAGTPEDAGTTSTFTPQVMIF